MPVHGLRLLAPAKINLHLRVGGPRADGFHPVLTWMVTAGLFDNLILELSHGPGAPDAAKLVGGGVGPAVRLSCDLPGLPCDSGNLVVRAAEALRGRILTPVAPVHIRLLKRIPVGAGLGGGSSDAASALQGLNALWGANWRAGELAALAAGLGSDLPFFFDGPSAICRGRGELVQPLSPPRARLALLIFPGRAMPTAAVYERFDDLLEMNRAGAASVEAEPDFGAWVRLGAAELLPLLVNDLEPAAFAIDPELGRLRGSVEEALSRIVRMSGSGSTLFSLYDGGEAAAARDAAVAVQRRHGVRCVVAEIAPKVDDDLARRE
jgi:4-diphosphocytidyl-2-C-methyl-D-erythritol kinase